MLVKLVLTLGFLWLASAQPICTWSLPANVSACGSVCQPRCTLNETITCVNSTCGDVAHCSINCTTAVYSNSSCPGCTSLCQDLNCPVDCTINDGLDCAWACEPMQNCTVPIPVLTCAPYYCESSGFSMGIHGLLLALLFS